MDVHTQTLTREKPEHVRWRGPCWVAMVIALVVNSDVVDGSKVVPDVAQCQLCGGGGDMDSSTGQLCYMYRTERERAAHLCCQTHTSNPMVLGVRTWLSSGIPADVHSITTSHSRQLEVAMVTKAAGILLTLLDPILSVWVEPCTLREEHQPQLSGERLCVMNMSEGGRETLTGVLVSASLFSPLSTENRGMILENILNKDN